MGHHADGSTRVPVQGRRIARRLGILGVAAVVVGAGVAGIGYPIYVHPQIEQPRRADAIVVLGGPGWGRYPFAIDLARRGWAPTLVVSNPNGDRDPWLADQCRRRQTYEMHCFAPDPPTTRGEARELRRLAAERGWRRVLVVTSRPHISRARFVLHRCFTGQLSKLEPAEPPTTWQWVQEWIFQTLGYLRAALQSGC